MLPMNPYYTGAAAAAAAAAANANMSPASAMSLIQAAMTPPPSLQGIVRSIGLSYGSFVRTATTTVTYNLTAAFQVNLG